MTEVRNTALLPTGLTDALPDQAEAEMSAVRCLMDTFGSWGYRAVKPPLLEFEEGLLTGPGAGLSKQVFRLMDPISQRMMGLRADMTPQIARLAATRLADMPRPLRLCYSGQVLRVRGNQLRPERQFTQAGIELIGADQVTADAEVLRLLVGALRRAGMKNLSVDLTVPALAPLVLRGTGHPDETIALAREALDGKDAGELKAAVGDDPMAHALLEAGGLAGPALKKLRSLNLSGTAGQLIDRLDAMVDLMTAAEPDLTLTIDPGEYRGFEYQTGIAFTVFARNVRGELARGGRYDTEHGESAVGATVYLDAMVRALEGRVAVHQVYAPVGTGQPVIDQARADGQRVISGLDDDGDAQDEARRLGCSHIILDGVVRPLA